MTEVILVFYEGRIEHWLRFGAEDGERILDRRRRVVSFAPDKIFAFVRWEANEYGTVLSRLDILRAPNAGEIVATVPGVAPGGEILLRLASWPRVKRAFDAIAQIEARASIPQRSRRIGGGTCTTGSPATCRTEHIPAVSMPSGNAVGESSDNVAYPTCILSVFGVVLLIAPSLFASLPILVWNATASAPRGLYRIAPPAALRAGDLVLLRPDPASAATYAERGYLPLGVPLLKRVGALGGMHVCEHAGDVMIDGRHVATAQPIDGRGRPMTSWSGCRALRDGELFALNADVPQSLDGRYFGPLPLSLVIGRALPLCIVSQR